MKSNFRAAILATFTIVVGGTFIACEHTTNDSDVPTAGVIMPLSVGNQWVYQTTTFDSLGGVVGTPVLDTVKIVSERMIGEEKWFVDNNNVVQRNKANGRYIYSGGAYLVDKFPAALNDSYRLYDSITTVRVRGTRETTVVRSVSYSTYIYRWEARSIVQWDFYCAANVGLVKAEKYQQSTVGSYVRERKELLWKSFN